jgi:hypothetical protein
MLAFGGMVATTAKMKTILGTASNALSFNQLNRLL